MNITSLDLVGNLWQINVFGSVDIFIKNVPLLIGLVLSLLFIIFYIQNNGIVPYSFIKFSLLIGSIALFFSSLVLTILQYYVFKEGPLQYALPPHKPITEYFVGYAFFNFWTVWIAGLTVTGIVSIYWWIVMKQSGGLRVNSKEILIFMLFGALAGWPAVMVYVFFVFAMYIGALLALNLARLDAERRIPVLRILHRFIKDDEVRTPIMPYFILAAPLAFLLSPTIFKILGLTGLYVVPRLFY